MTSVLLIDDHPVVLQGCQQILKDAGFQPVLVASDFTSGYQVYQQQKPTVVIVDLAMQSGRLGGLTLIRKIRSHDVATPILVFSMYNDARIVAEAFEAGASGYVLKDTSPAELVNALNLVLQGRSYLARDLAVEVARTHQRQPPLSDLTARELQALKLLSEGKPYSRIAAELNISYKTVVNICYQLRQKLEVGTLPELVRRATELMSTMP
jgi:DNA-binding NarL/FixJ family response regulator